MFPQATTTPGSAPGTALAREEAVVARVAELMGVVNAALGELVEVIGPVVRDELGLGPGVHTPAAWVAWRTGLAPAQARNLVRLAERAEELPCTTAALAEGRLSVDQAAEIARHVPAAYDHDATEVGRQMTVRQLRRALPRYGYEPATGEGSDGPASPSPPVEPSAERTFSIGSDERGWWLRGRLPAHEGAVVDRAIRAVRDDLWRRARHDHPDETPAVTGADALLAVAEGALRAGEARLPGTDRYLVHLHYESTPERSTGAGTGGEADPTLAVHLGPRIPGGLRHLLLCDPRIGPVEHRGGVPVNLGRTTRVVGRRLRRLVEHRDGGCAIGGCGATVGLEIHHVVHWEHGGATDTGNLLTLCRRHHHQHHAGALAIAGDADLPRGHPDGLRVADRWGRPLTPSAEPEPVVAGEPATRQAATRGIDPGPYPSPLGERLCSWGFHLNARRRPPARPATRFDAPAGGP